MDEGTEHLQQQVHLFDEPWTSDSAADPYMATVLAGVADVLYGDQPASGQAPTALTPRRLSDRQLVQARTSEEEARLRRHIAQAKNAQSVYMPNTSGAQDVQQVGSNAPPGASYRLRLQRPTASATTAWLELCEGPDGSGVKVMQEEYGAPGKPPPFVPTAEVPSINDTMDLHNLAPWQRFAFAMMADTLQQEHESQREAASGRQPLTLQPAIDRLFMALTGDPGTGKSQVIRAVQWYTYQLKAAELLVPTAFTWRACQQIMSPAHVALSSCRTFGLNGNGDSAKNRQRQRDGLLQPARLLINDEISFTSCEHLAACSAAATKARLGTQQAGGGTVTDAAPFGGMHVVLCGDPQQKKPVGGNTLFARLPDHDDLLLASHAADGNAAAAAYLHKRAAAAASAAEAAAAATETDAAATPEAQAATKATRCQRRAATTKAIRNIAAPRTAKNKTDSQRRVTGRNIFLGITKAVVLRDQFRQLGHLPGAIILSNLNRFCRMTRAQREHLAPGFVPWFVDMANLRYHSARHVQHLVSKRGAEVVTPRNRIKQVLRPRMALLHAAREGVRPAVWHACDLRATADAGYRPVTDPSAVRQLLNVQQDNAGNIMSVGVFFPGCKYVFVDSEAPGVGRVSSGSAEGVKLLLDRREPPDDGTGPYHRLRYHPIGIVVRPTDRGRAPPVTGEEGEYLDTVPPGCVALDLKTAKIDKLDFPAKQPLVIDGVARNTVSLKRTGFHLALGYAYTDHYCQGSSFPLGQPWLLHLTPPPGPATDWDGKGILVTCTRNMAWGDVHLLAPLYTNDAERAAVITRFERAFARSEEEEADMERLADLAKHTKEADWERLAAKYKLIPDGWTKPLTQEQLTPLDTSLDGNTLAAQLRAYEDELHIWDDL
jgi:hypothetical protein